MKSFASTIFLKRKKWAVGLIPIRLTIQKYKLYLYLFSFTKYIFLDKLAEVYFIFRLGIYLFQGGEILLGYIKNSKNVWLLK